MNRFVNYISTFDALEEYYSSMEEENQLPIEVLKRHAATFAKNTLFKEDCTLKMVNIKLTNHYEYKLKMMDITKLNNIFLLEKIKNRHDVRMTSCTNLSTLNERTYFRNNKYYFFNNNMTDVDIEAYVIPLDEQGWPYIINSELSLETYATYLIYMSYKVMAIKRLISQKALLDKELDYRIKHRELIASSRVITTEDFEENVMFNL